MRRIIVICLLVLLPLRGAAQDLSGLTGLMDSLPDQTLKALRDGPDWFLTDGAELILGYGGPQGLDRAGIERVIAIRRAEIREREMRRLMLADLDDDGRVSQDEIGFLAATAAAGARARLVLGQVAADLDRDGHADLTEVRRHARGIALSEVTAEDAERFYTFLLFDLDGDGKVTLAELQRGVAALRTRA